MAARLRNVLLLVIPTVQAGPLHEAAESGDLNATRRLLVDGADINARDVNAATPLHWAVYAGHTVLARWLIARGAHVYANERPFCPAPQFLPKPSDDTSGARLDHQDTNILQTSVTPLHWAAAGGHLATVELLVSEGANVNATTVEGVTPLQTAVGMGHQHIVNLLQQLGAK